MQLPTILFMCRRAIGHKLPPVCDPDIVYHVFVFSVVPVITLLFIILFIFYILFYLLGGSSRPLRLLGAAHKLLAVYVP